MPAAKINPQNFKNISSGITSSEHCNEPLIPVIGDKVVILHQAENELAALVLKADQHVFRLRILNGLFDGTEIELPKEKIGIKLKD